MLLWTTQESTPKNASADETKSRRAFESSRRLIFVFFLLLSINICSQVSSFGVFQIRFTSLANDRGLDIDGRCCVGGGGGGDDDGVPRGAAGTDGGGGGGSSGAAAAAAAVAAVVAAEDVCGGPCRTFFTVCLRHFQETLPTTDVECTFGENATGVVALNSFDESDDTANYTVSIPLDFSWPNSFSLFVKAWHNTTVVGPSKGSSSSSSSSRTLIAEFAIKRNLSVGEDWRHDLDVGVRVRIGYAYRVVCSENFIGPGCSDKCTPRDDKHGHYNCSRNGSKLCLPGWTGEYCLTAICLDGCNTTNGFCDEPFECKCRGGWKGKLCNECKPHPDCRHGNCSDKHQCNCFEGWGGLHCDEDLNYCTNHEPCENGATCKNTGEGSYTCLCPVEFTGTDCETEIFDCHKNVCLNGGVCDMSDGQHRCLCRKGFSGRRCETSARNCRENPCKNLGTCHSFDDGHLMSYTCHCRPGFTGPTCETDVTVDECASTPCVNGGQCIDEDGGYRCACASGFTGARCEHDVDDDGDCLRDPCLNGGTCSADAADDGRFRCRCSPGFTGDRCREDVDDCATRPCANGATCVDDGANAFACLCAHGFTGRDCSAKVDDCRSRPCRRGTCLLDLVNGYRCLCEGGFTGTNCEEKTMGGGGDETNGDSTTTSFDHNSPETDVPPTTDSYLRQVMLVVCLGLLLMLLIICVAVVAFVLQHRRRRRSRRRRSPSGDSKQKMNNAAVDHGDGGGGGAGGGYYDEKREKSKGGAGHLDVVLKSQQQQQHRSEFAVREPVRVQRNINDATNLKNVEKCSNRKQKVLDWNNAGLIESNAAKSPEHNGRPESKTNIDHTKETNVWKQSDGTLSKRVPSNVICGSQVYLRPEPAVFSGRSIATEV